MILDGYNIVVMTIFKPENEGLELENEGLELENEGLELENEGLELGFFQILPPKKRMSRQLSTSPQRSHAVNVPWWVRLSLGGSR